MAYPPTPPPPGAHRPQEPPSDPLTQWGIKPNPTRPQKANWFTQALWAYMAASVLMLLFAIIAVATAPWWLATGFIVTSGIVGLLFHSLSVVTVYFVVKEKLGVFGAADPRNPLLIALGILGFFALSGFFGGWGLGWYAALGGLLGLVRLAAVGAAFALVFQPEFVDWLRSRPGNQRKNPPTAPPGHPTQPPPPPGYQAPPPQQQPPHQP